VHARVAPARMAVVQMRVMGEGADRLHVRNVSGAGVGVNRAARGVQQEAAA